MVFKGIQIKGSVQEILELCYVHFLVSSSGSCSRWTTRIPNRLGAGNGGSHAWFDIVVVTLVLVLLLAPHHVSVGVLITLSFHQVEGEGRELFNASDGHSVVHSVGLAVPGEFIVDLPRTEDDALHTLRILGGGACLWNHPQEVGARKHVVKAGPGLGVTEKRLGSEDDERFPEGL